MSQEFLWDVILPRSQSFFHDAHPARKKLAQVLIFKGSPSERSFFVPLMVGRKLLTLKRRQEGIDSLSALNERIAQLKEDCLRHKIEDLISRKDWGKQEITCKLSELGYDPCAIEARVKRLEETLVINDAHYIELFIRSKRNLGWGPKKIEQELKRKQLEVPSHDALMKVYERDESEMDIAKRAIARKSFRGKDPYAQAMRFLLARGFSYGVSAALAKKYSRFDD